MAIGLLRLLAAGAVALLALTGLNGVAQGQPFSGTLEPLAGAETAASAAGAGFLYSVLDYYPEGPKLMVNGTFEGLSSPATVAHLHRAAAGPDAPGAADARTAGVRSDRVGGAAGHAQRQFLDHRGAGRGAAPGTVLRAGPLAGPSRGGAARLARAGLPAQPGRCGPLGVCAAERRATATGLVGRQAEAVRRRLAGWHEQRRANGVLRVGRCAGGRARAGRR